MDGIVTKAQVGNGDAAGFFGVIGKIALGIHVRLVANDFDGTLVGADRAVAPKAPEKAAARTLGRYDYPDWNDSTYCNERDFDEYVLA